MSSHLPVQIKIIVNRKSLSQMTNTTTVAETLTIGQFFSDSRLRKKN